MDRVEAEVAAGSLNSPSRSGERGLERLRTIAKYCPNQDLQDFEIFRIFPNPEHPCILIILIQGIKVTNDFAIVLWSH